MRFQSSLDNKTTDVRAKLKQFDYLIWLRNEMTKEKGGPFVKLVLNSLFITPAWQTFNLMAFLPTVELQLSQWEYTVFLCQYDWCERSPQKGCNRPCQSGPPRLSFMQQTPFIWKAVSCHTLRRPWKQFGSHDGGCMEVFSPSCQKLDLCLQWETCKNAFVSKDWFVFFLFIVFIQSACKVQIPVRFHRGHLYPKCWWKVLPSHS